MKLVLILASSVAILALGGNGFFLVKNQSLNQQLNEAGAKNSTLAQELSNYKNTDLGKEIEILKLKLASSQTEATALKTKVTTYETNTPKAISYLGVIDEIRRTYFGGSSPWDLEPIETKVAAVADKKLSQLWVEVKKSTDPQKGSYSPNDVDALTLYIVTKISELLRI